MVQSGPRGPKMLGGARWSILGNKLNFGLNFKVRNLLIVGQLGGTRWSKVVQDGSRWFKMVQDGANCLFWV